MCPLRFAVLIPALWLCRHGCHTVIASRSLPRVSMVRGLSCAQPSMGDFGGQEPRPGRSSGPEGDHTKTNLSPKYGASMEVLLRDTLVFLQHLIIGS